MAKKSRKHLFSRFSLAWTRLFSTSVFAWFASLYEKANTRLQENLSRQKHKRSLRRRRRVLKVKNLFADQIGESFFTVLCKNCAHFLLSVRLKSLGLLFFLFGFSNCLIFLAERFLPFSASADSTNLVFGAILTLSSLPLFWRRRSLSVALQKSRFIGSFLENVVLLRDAEYPQTHAHSADSLCMLGGLLLGLASLFFHPFAILFFLMMVLFAALSLYKPEFGAAVWLFTLPFSSARSSILILLFVVFCLLLKVLRGKRTLRLELNGWAALFFSLFLLLCGLFSVLPANQNAFYLFFATLSFFLISNLVARRQVFSVLLSSFAFGAALCSATRLLFFFLPESVVTGSMRVLSHNLTQNASVAICVAALAITLFLAMRSDFALRRLFFFVCFVLLVCDLWVYSSGAAFLAAILSVVLLLAVSSRAMFFSLALLGIAAAIVLPLIEGTQTAALWSALENRGPSLFFSGLPQSSFIFGLGAFSPESLTALNLSELLANELSFYSQLLLSVGLFGSLLLFVFLLFCFQKGIHYYITSAFNRSRLLAAAPLFSILALLVVGMTQNTLLDARVFSLLFVFGAISSSAVNTLRNEDNVLLQQF